MPPYDFETYNDGYWGNTTSTLDWCEINYEVIISNGKVENSFDLKFKIFINMQ